MRWRPGERLEQLFERRSEELGDALAVDGPAGRVSYAELEARANRLARLLARRDVRGGDRVGLLFAEPLQSYVAMLAVLKLGAAYVPLDPSLPPDRLSFIAADCGMRTMLTDPACRARVGSVAGVGALSLDELRAELAELPADRLRASEVGEPPDDLCYVIYTSGTTGRPKGVAVGHPSIVNFVRVADEVYGVRAHDRMYQGLTIAFDFSIEEIWVAWMAGATLVPKPGPEPLLGADLHDFLTEHRVSALCCVPTVLDTVEEDLPRLRFLLVSGESCPHDLVTRWWRPERRLLNVYGPTEATVSATLALLEPSRPVTIGRPLPTYSAVVLDPDADCLAAPGALGELGLAGVGLADGYLGRPELTSRAFIPDFVGMPQNPSGRIYRTGDLVRVTADGELEHHGRIDTQVKIRGYRIELAEVETALRAVAGVAGAVVEARELQAGVTELVGYYVADADLEPERVGSQLRRSLPPYMVPRHLERLTNLPLLPSGKVDRRSLPEPRALSRVPAPETYAAPGSSLERTLAEELAAALDVGRVSADSHFFDELGANSLLMARFVGRIRRSAGDSAPVSIRDVYMHPTVRDLAKAIAARDPAPAPQGEDLELSPAGGPARYRLCGVLQLLTFALFAWLVAVVLDYGSAWLLGAHGALSVYARAVEFGGAILLATAVVPIVAKWTLVGRWKPQRIRIWSLAYFRFWIVKTLLVFNPLPRLLVGSPLYPLYLRALGARVSARALILTAHVPVCTDLLSIGPDAVIHKDVYLNGYRARAGLIEIGPVSVGERAFVGEHAVLEIGTELGPGAQLGHSSALLAAQAVPAGARWYGSPAQPAPVEYDYGLGTSSPPAPIQRITYCIGRLLLLAGLVGPLEAAAGDLLLSHSSRVNHLPLAALAGIAGVLLVAGLLGSLVIAAGVPRLLTRALAPGKVYPLYGLHYGITRLIARASNNPMLTGLLGDSCAIVHYLRMLGYRFGVIEQTGSNFGLEIRQDIPALSHVGTGTMVSDGLSIMNAEFSGTSFRIRPVRIGRRSYVGNGISYPAAARIGEDCLLATKALVPIGGPVRTGVGLLGSPPFEIPRSVTRDRQFDELSSGEQRRRRLAAKTRHNVVTMLLHLLVSYLLLLGLLAIAGAPLDGSGLTHILGTVASALLEVTFVFALFLLSERAVTGFRPLQPRCCSIYQIEFWRHERFWKVAANGYVRVLDGTPFKRLLWRALGVPVGPRLFDDGLAITERTLVAIGAECTFNMGSNLQSHTLEDGVFKSDHIVVGDRCTVGTSALVNYGAVMQDDAVLEADAFLMKGSSVPAGARWRGNPAAEAVCAQPGDRSDIAGEELELEAA